MIILPLTYWGSIEHFAQLRQGGEEAVIDLGENYVKRSERNRTEIVTPTGGMVLSVPLIKANRPRTPMRDMRIDNSKRWQHQHWVAILSAYRSSPYFDYIADRIAPIYEREWNYLIDLNRMKFHKMDFDQRMKNFSRLTTDEEVIRIMSDEYARLITRKREEVFERMLFYTTHMLWHNSSLLLYRISTYLLPDAARLLFPALQLFYTTQMLDCNFALLLHLYGT